MILSIPLLSCLAAAQTTPLQALRERLDNTTHALNQTHRDLSQAVNGLPALTWDRACPANHGFGSYSYSLGHNSLYPNISVNTDVVMFKQVEGQAPLRVINGIQSVLPVFQSNLAQINRSTWQYVGGHDVFGIHPAFNFTTCSAPANQQYCPTCRPWWTSSTIGKGNYVFFLDITQGHNSTDFEYQRNMVAKFIETLSFYDYFTVITYDVLGYEYSDGLVQATDTNKADAIAWVNRQIDDGLRSTSVGTVLNESLALLNRSIADGSSANCHNYFLLFSLGDATINDPHPFDVLKSKLAQTNSTLTISVFLIEEGRNADVFEGMTCRTSGFISIVNTSLLPRDHLMTFNMWYSKYINIRNVRYSAIYVDAFGLGHMTTGGKPVYNGTGHVLVVNAIDVTVDGINMTIDEINRALQSRQECEALLLPVVRTSTCPQKNPAEAEAKPALVEHKDLIFGFSVTATVLYTFFMIYRYTQKAEGDRDESAGLLVVLWIGACVAWVVFWVCYLPYLYPDQIVHTYYKETKEYTTGVTVRPYECTETRNCQCSNYHGQSCTSASHALLANGSLTWTLPCQTGYHCCEWITYCGQWATSCSTSCSGSGSSRSCYTSCYDYCVYWVDECVRDVSQRACNQVRGICNRVYVDTEYIVDTGTVNAVRSTNCRLNNTGCVNNFIGNFAPIGDFIEGWYNPWNPTEVIRERGWNIAAWVFLSFACVYLLVIIVMSLMYECRDVEVDCPPACCVAIGDACSKISCPDCTDGDSGSKDAQVAASHGPEPSSQPTNYYPQPPPQPYGQPYGQPLPPPPYGAPAGGIHPPPPAMYPPSNPHPGPYGSVQATGYPERAPPKQAGWWPGQTAI